MELDVVLRRIESLSRLGLDLFGLNVELLIFMDNSL